MAKTAKIVLADTIEYAANIEMKYFVGMDGALCGAGEKALGVSLRSTQSGSPGPVGVLGIFPVIAGAAVTQGNAVTSDAQGRAVEAADVAVSSVITTEVTVPVGSTPVTSDAAQPDLSESSDAVNTVSGGVLPVAINGYALDAASQAGDEIRVVRLG